MKTKVFLLLSLSVLLLGTTTTRADETRTDAVERLQSATQVLHEILNTPDKGIPKEVLKGARCVAVVPRLIKGGFILAGKHGRGVATCELPNHTWSSPAFFVISGGSWGLQIGVQSVDLVLMIMNDEGMRHLLGDKFEISGTAAAAVGPVGRDASAGIDWKVSTQMLTYSRSRGVFAGIDLGGSVVERDKDSTVAFYGKDLPTREILDGKVSAPADARPFVAEVRRAELRAEGRAKGY